MAKKIKREFTVRITGHPAKTMTFGTGISRCGVITDGISISFPQSGYWVMRYRDLKRIYEAATKVRALV